MNIIKQYDDIILSMLLFMVFSILILHFTRELSEKYREGFIGKILIVGTGVIISYLVVDFTFIIPELESKFDIFPTILMSTYFLSGVVPTILIAVAQCVFNVMEYGATTMIFHEAIRMAVHILLFYVIYKRFDSNKKFLPWFLSLLAISFFGIVTSYIPLVEMDYENFDYVIHFVVIFILGSLAQYFVLYNMQASTKIYHSYKQDASTDFLTGLWNRRAFEVQLNSELKYTAKHKSSLSCLMIDIDFFKKINDTYGHPNGDIVLKEVASCLKLNLPKEAIIGRVGGEEFCVLLQGYKKEDAILVANRLNKTVESTRIRINTSHILSITVSIGVSNYPESTKDASQLKELADNALYDAKHSGRNKVCSS